MRKLTQMCSVILVALALVASVIWTSPVFAQGPEVAILDESTAEIVVLSVSADGQYLINREGNNPDEILTVTAKNGRLEFDLGGKKAFQIQNIVPTDESSVWKIVTEDGWVGLDDSIQTADTPMTIAAPTNGEPYNLQGDNGEFVDCGMWYVEPDKKLMTWTGGSNSVHTCFNQPAKDLLEEGYVAEFTMIVESDVRACRSYWSGVDLDGNLMVPYVPAGCWIFTLRPGTYRVHGWAFDPLCGIQIGFRAVPVDTDPWEETQTCDDCVWPFPIAKIQPIYRKMVMTNSISQAPTTSVAPVSTQTSNDAGAQALEEVRALRDEFATFQCVILAKISGTDGTYCQPE